MDPSGIVVKPKLRAPALRPEQLARPRLLEHLGEVLDRKITVVSGPAGYGKTTLLAQWNQAEPRLHFAWVSLDKRDNDPVRLWRHVVESLRRDSPPEEFGADALVVLGAAGSRLVETPLPMLLNELAELPHRVVVILDDYQFVTEEECHESVAFFVEHLPTNVHLVVSSRNDPTLPLGRWRAKGEMNEIRTDQLAFSDEEAAHLLNESLGLDVGPDDLSVLMERTEGWPAAIYLAALSLRQREDRHAFIESFGGSNRYIVDLLAEEVLSVLPEETREFLLRTSVLSKMKGSLCDAVAGREGSAKLLRELARSNLFVVPLGEQGEWYRYHHLFSDLLLYELKSTRPELIPVLHRRASLWLEKAGSFEGAIEHAITAADYGRASLLIARHWFGYLVSGQTATVERWLEALPEELIMHDAALLLVRAWVCALFGRCEESEWFLALAESIPHEGPLPDGTASVESGAVTVRASFGFNGIQSALEASRLAAELEPELSSPRAALVRFGLGVSSYLSGETSKARKQLDAALELADAGQPLMQIVVRCFLSLVATDEGHLEEAESLANEAQGLVDRFGLRGIPQATLAPIALGYMLARRGDLAEAQTELEGGLARRASPGLSPWPTLIGLLALAQVRIASGDRDGGKEVLAEARDILEPFGDDTGIFSDLLERQERKLRTRKRRDGSLNGELTPRELDVLGLLDGEQSTRQIADSLYVATSTVRTQVKSIYRKLGVSSREQAVDEGHARGLI